MFNFSSRVFTGRMFAAFSTLCQLGTFSCFFSADSFKSNCFQKILPGRNTIRVSNSLDPDQTRQNVGSDLGPNSLKKLSQ